MKPVILCLTKTQLRQCVRMDEIALERIENAFAALSNGRAFAPPIMRLDFPENDGEIDVKSASIQGLPVVAVKVATGFYGNPKKGLNSTQGLMLLLSTETGETRAILIDEGELTGIRTALAGAVASKYLAPKQVSAVGVIGSGMQARLQLEALRLVRRFDRVFVYSRDASMREGCAAELAKKLGVSAQAVSSAEQVVRESQIVVTTTPSTQAIVRAEWLHPGLHITAVGSDAEHKQELESDVLKRADLYVCDSRVQVARLGELRHALAAGYADLKEKAVELGEVVSGRISGRTREDQITICDLTGSGVQDTAIAHYAYERALALGLGSRVDAQS